MEQLIQSIADANVWAVLGGIIVVIVGSSALTMWIQKLFEARSEGKEFRRQVRSSAIDAATAAYVSYVEYQSSSDADLAAENAATEARVLGEIAKAGSPKLVSLARDFTEAAGRYATNDPFTSVEHLNEAFEKLIDEIVKSTPA